MQFLQSFGLLLLLLLVLQLKFVQSFIFLDEPIKGLLFLAPLKFHLFFSSLLFLFFIIQKPFIVGDPFDDGLALAVKDEASPGFYSRSPALRSVDSIVRNLQSFQAVVLCLAVL